MSNSSSSSSGIGLLGALGILFVGLKLGNVINCRSGIRQYFLY